MLVCVVETPERGSKDGHYQDALYYTFVKLKKHGKGSILFNKSRGEANFVYCGLNGKTAASSSNRKFLKQEAKNSYLLER